MNTVVVWWVPEKVTLYTLLYVEVVQGCKGLCTCVMDVQQGQKLYSWLPSATMVLV